MTEDEVNELINEAFGGFLVENLELVLVFLIDSGVLYHHDSHGLVFEEATEAEDHLVRALCAKRREVAGMRALDRSRFHQIYNATAPVRAAVDAGEHPDEIFARITGEG